MDVAITLILYIYIHITSEHFFENWIFVNKSIYYSYYSMTYTRNRYLVTSYTHMHTRAHMHTRTCHESNIGSLKRDIDERATIPMRIGARAVRVCCRFE